MIPARVQLEDVVRGDTWPGIPQVGPVTIGGVRPLSALAVVQIVFSRVSGQAPAYVIKSAPGAGQGPVVIDDAAQWLFSVPPQHLPLAAGPWQFEVRLADAASPPLVMTPIFGTVNVLQDFPPT